MEEKRIIHLSDYEHRVMVHALNAFRTDLIEAKRDTEPVDNIMLKVIRSKADGTRKHADGRVR